MPEETETVNGSPVPEQKSDAEHGSEGQTNGQTVESEPSHEEVDVCTLKAKIIAEGETIEAPVCPLVKETEPEQAVSDLVEETLNNSNESNGTALEESPQETVPAVEAEQTVVEAVQDEPEPVPSEPETQQESAKTPEPEVPQPEEPEPISEPAPEPVAIQPRAVPLEISKPVSNGQTNGDHVELKPEETDEDPSTKAKVLNGTIANELKTEDYKLPEVVEVKKHFEQVESSAPGDAPQLPRKGALTTNLDAASVRGAYEDVRRDGSDTQWAVFKYEGPKIVTSATGTDFDQFRNQFGDEDRAFGYLRVQTGDEMSKRAKFLLITWVGPSVSVLKRAKMSTDKALIKGVVSNFAVELQTENIADVNLENFENELAKAGGAHYGTGIRS
ncbi:uncharacterized protein LOC143200929 [Rhynchophorus ferrugineus]|uniref:uncharacterized protein LOC143200929 n=1 Tax=Rhynchophorus ferrugineus TaxID=354439 RepID=UPI003FCC7427